MSATAWACRRASSNSQSDSTPRSSRTTASSLAALFTHVEPWLDANDILQLWYFEGLPDTPEKLAKSFAAVPQRVLFSGHAHRWFLATPEGPCEWAGGPARLAPPGRYLVILHPVALGHCAVYDTATAELTPPRLPTGHPLSSSAINTLAG